MDEDTAKELIELVEKYIKDKNSKNSSHIM